MAKQRTFRNLQSQCNRRNLPERTMARTRLWLATAKDLALPSLAVLMICVLLYVLLRNDPQPRRPITVTAGRNAGQRHHFVRLLAREAATQNLVLVERETAGSEAALDLVNAGKVDVALLQGGLAQHARANVRQV